MARPEDVHRMPGNRTRTAGGAETVPGQVVIADGPPSSVFEPGALLADRYRVRRFLGRGGMGEVYECDDEELGRRVAIKVLIAALFDEERATTLLRREISAARRVTHPSVCRVYDVSYHRDPLGRAIALYSMELLEGETLADRLQRRGRFTPAECLPILEQACAGLAAAHAAGVIHRDLKPHNVMLCGDRAVVADFGLAIALEAGDPTRSMELMGTPAYMAPEQVDGGAITTATDVFALGVTLFELVTGELPFRSSSPLGAALARLKGTAPRADSTCPGLDRRWADVIERCLARDPAARRALDELVAALSDGAQPLPAARTRPHRRRVRVGVAVALGLAVAVAAVAGGALWSRSPTSNRPQIIERFAVGAVAGVLGAGEPGPEKIEDTAHDADGNLYIVGHGGTGAHLGRTALDAWGRPYLAFVARIDRDGRLRWTRTFPASSRISIGSVAIADGQLYLAGHVLHGEYDLGDGTRTIEAFSLGFVIAVSAADGRVHWRQRVASAGESYARAIEVGPDGHVYVIGDHAGATDFGDGVTRTPDITSPYVASYERGGGLRWVLAGRAGSNARGRALAFADGAVLAAGSAAGDVEFAGATWSAGIVRRAFVAAIDQRTGEPRWVYRFAVSSEIWAVEPDSTGGVVVAGGFSGRLEVVPGQVLEASALHGRPLLASLGMDRGTLRWARAIDGGPDTGWSIRTLGSLPDERWIIGGAFDGELAAGAHGGRARGQLDGYVAIIDAHAAVEQLAVITGPGTERMRGLALPAPGVLATWGCHDGAILGGREVASTGLSDGFYAELRLDELFR
jgi:hypothetical protein